MASAQPSSTAQQEAETNTERSWDEGDTKFVMLVKFACYCAPVNQFYHRLEAVLVNTEDLGALENSMQPILRRIIPNSAGVRLLPSVVQYKINWDGHGDVYSPDLKTLAREDFKNQFLMIRLRGFRDILVVYYNYMVDNTFRHTFQQLEPVQLDAMGTAHLGAGSNLDGEHTASFANLGILGGGESIVMDSEQYDSLFEADEGAIAATEVGDDKADSHETNSSATEVGDDKANSHETNSSATEVGDDKANSHETNSSASGRLDAKWQHCLSETPARAPSHSTQSGSATLVVYGPEREILAEMPLTNPAWLNTFAGKPTLKTLAHTIRRMEIDETRASLGSARSVANTTTLPLASRSACDPEKIRSNTPSRKSFGDKGLGPLGLAYTHLHGTRQSSLSASLGTAEVNGGSNGGLSKAAYSRSAPALTRLVGIGRGNRVVYGYGRRASSAPLAFRPSHTKIAPRHADSPPSPKLARYDITPEKPDPVCSTRIS
ncbi:hypothetical protein F5X97DRAFT_343682 [Nemania serpens]|nr:hypothetical protein F5X97DRAFT_343682 [Nemania serpens]